MRVLKWLGVLLSVIVVLLFGAVQYFKSSAHAALQEKYDIPVDPIPIPFPLSEEELTQLREERAKSSASAAGTGQADQGQAVPSEGAPSEAQADPLAGVDLEALALERAIARGKKYLSSRAGCPECHGDDLAGKVVIDEAVMGKWIAPNITRGGVTKDYKSEDWVRLVRHGVKPDGRPSTMPSQDFTNFSDQEISDIAAYIHSLPAVDRVMPETELGPVFAMLLATGNIPLSAKTLDHQTKRPVYPPRADTVSVELGRHIGTTCVGCHGPSLSGGPIKGGDPNWPPARNITFHESGIAQWSLSDFVKAMREGVRPDGAKVQAPMPIAYTKELSDAELESLYVYLKSLPPKATASD